MRRAERSGGDETCRYDAFISYSHDADGDLAVALQRGLTRFAKSWRQRRALEVFRDETGLSTNPALWESIVAALGDSRWFILLASPQAAASEWVQREVSQWLATKGAGRILPVVTGGEWRWDPQRNDFTDDSSAVPPTLRGAFGGEPRHLDLRWARPAGDLDRRHAQLQGAIADLAAPIHGVPKDELEGEDVRQHRRTQRITRAAVSVLVLLLVLSVLSAVTAFVQRGQARSEARLADAHRLAALAVSTTSSDLSRAMLLAMEGQRLADDSQTRGALLTVVQRAQQVQRIIHGSWQAAAIAPGGSAVYALNGDWISRVDLASGQITRLAVGAPSGTRCLGVSPDGTLLAVGTDQGVAVLDARTGALRGALLSSAYHGITDPVASVRFSADGSMVAEMDQGGRGAEWAVATGQLLGTFVNGVSSDSQPEVAFSPAGDILASTGAPGLVYDALTVSQLYPGLILSSGVAPDQAIAFSPDGTRLAVASAAGVFFRDPATGATDDPEIPVAGAAPILKLAFSPDGTVLAGGRADGSVQLWNAATGVTLQAPLVGASRAPLDLAFTDDDHLVEVTGREIVTFDTAAHLARVLGQSASAVPGAINAIAVSPDHQLMAVANSASNVIVWNASGVPRDAVITTPAAGSGIWSVVFVTDTELAVAGDDGTVTFWDARTAQEEGQPVPLTGSATVGASDTGVGVGALGLAHGQVVAFTANGHVVSIDPSDHQSDGEVDLLLRQAPPIRMAVRGDGQQLALGAPDGVELMDLHGGARHTLDVGAVDSLAYAPDGATLAVGLNDGRILLVDTRHLDGPAPTLASNHGGVWSLAFDPTGSTLAAGGEDGTVTLWDTATDLAEGPALSSQTGDVDAVAFINGGRQIVAGASDETVAEYDIDPAALRLTACAIANRNLTPTEWQQYLPTYPYHATCGSLPGNRPA